MARNLTLFGFLLACACSSTVSDGALRVSVHFANTPAQCAKVQVTGRNARQTSSAPLSRTDHDLKVGLLETSDLGASVDVQAQGFAAADCGGTPVDSSAVFHQQFRAGKVDEVTLVLDGGLGGGGGGGGGVGGGGGSGGGGGTGGGGGGSVTPENCSNGLDDDGDFLIDCFDPDCDGVYCAPSKACVSSACVLANLESDCANGLDDNGDGKIDCDDPTCATRGCNDNDLCTKGDTCQSGACTGTAYTCSAPNQCQVTGSGMCEGDGGCTYTPQAGSCTGGTCSNGTCISAGFPYTPSNFNPQVATLFIAPPVVLDCGVSKFDSTTLSFSNWCGQPQPTPQVIFRAGNSNLVVLAMQSLEVKGTLQLTGSQPVVLAVYGDATVSGTLSASGSHDTPGAGAPALTCFGGNGGDGSVFSAAGGGGAGFGKSGARGGDAIGVMSGGHAGSVNGTVPVPLSAGCNGGDGAVALNLQLAAKGGGGGGALQLSAAGNLTVSGKVSANGGGGRGATGTAAGGGGGGSGGAIVLEANLLTLTSSAQLTAQGGAGGAGALDNTPGGDGADGHDADGDKAVGANGQNPAGNGGDGASLNDTSATSGDPGGSSGPDNGGGGGGGAGYGRIWLHSVSTCSVDGNALIAPDAAPSGNCP